MSTDYKFPIESPRYGLIWVTAPRRFRQQIEQYTWCACLQPRRAGGRQFEIRTHRNGAPLYLHRFIWELSGRSPAARLDHRDGQPCNNSEENIRPATQVQNSHNVRRKKNNTTGYIGVSWNSSRNRFYAYIVDNGGRMKSLGRYLNIEDARAARDAAAFAMRGEFAVLNQVASA